MGNYAVLLAGGVGERMGAGLPKQFIEIAGKTVIEHSIEAFEKHEMVDGIVIVIVSEYHKQLEEIIEKNKYKKVMNVVNGGASRKESSMIGVKVIADKFADDSNINLLIHTVARCGITEKIITDCINALKDHPVVVPYIPVSDSIAVKHMVGNDSFIKEVPNRDNLIVPQTPECFSLKIIKEAHSLIKETDKFNEDSAAVLKYKLADIFLVEGDVRNLKLTLPQDIIILERFLSEEARTILTQP